MKLFLATPITNWIDPDTGSLFQHKRILLFSIKKELEKLGHTVFLAIEREAWGRDLSGPDESIEADLAALKDSDVVVCLPGNPPSGGAHVELGWASLLHKPIILVLEEKGVYSPLVLGLHKMTRARRVTFKDNIAAIAQDIQKELESLTVEQRPG